MIKFSNNRCHDGAAPACGSTGHSTIAGRHRRVRGHGSTTGEWDVAIALLANSLATGARLFVLIMVFGPISGAHFNPAVSLVAAVRGKLSRAHLPLYVLVPLGGAIIGVWIIGVRIAHTMFDLDLLQTSAKTRTGASQWCAEFAATFELLLTILVGVLRINARN